MVYVDDSEMGWQPYTESWLARAEPEAKETLRGLIERCIPKLVSIKEGRCKEPVPLAALGGVRSLCLMYEAFATKANGVEPKEDGHARIVELWFLFCTIWSLGGSVDDESRKDIDAAMRELDAQIPHKDSVYDYFVNVKDKRFAQGRALPVLLPGAVCPVDDSHRDVRHAGGHTGRKSSPARTGFRRMNPFTRSSCQPSTRRATRTCWPLSCVPNGTHSSRATLAWAKHP